MGTLGEKLSNYCDFFFFFFFFFWGFQDFLIYLAKYFWSPLNSPNLIAQQRFARAM